MSYSWLNKPTWKRLAVLLSLVLSRLAAAPQSEGVEATRQLYYLASSSKESLPPVKRDSAATEAPKPGVVHLGLRYNLVLVDGSGKSKPISSDRILRNGDCFAIDLQSNRSGYLYVLAKQSSGSWMPLLPSVQMPDERNVVDPGRKIRIPKSYCFEVHNPAGAETLFVVLSRDPRDFYELYEGIKQKEANAASAAPKQLGSGAGTLTAAVDHLNQRFGTRDIVIRKAETPEANDEPRGSVYVVNASDKPVSSLVTEIHVRHR